MNADVMGLLRSTRRPHYSALPFARMKKPYKKKERMEMNLLLKGDKCLIDVVSAFIKAFEGSWE